MVGLAAFSVIAMSTFPVIATLTVPVPVDVVTVDHAPLPPIPPSLVRSLRSVTLLLGVIATLLSAN